jgi:hypothetical protein
MKNGRETMIPDIFHGWQEQNRQERFSHRLSDDPQGTCDGWQAQKIARNDF